MTQIKITFQTDGSSFVEIAENGVTVNRKGFFTPEQTENLVLAFIDRVPPVRVEPVKSGCDCEQNSDYCVNCWGF